MKISTDHPPIPKRFASRLRVVYAKLADVRRSIAHGEAEIAYLREYLAYYESDPEQFAQRHYPRHGVNSYPVVTHIGRSRESLSYRECRVPEYYSELPAAEEAVTVAEADVLEQLARMRESTPGREPWPQAPIALDQLRRVTMSDRMRELRKYLKHVAVHSEKRKAQEEKRQAKLKAYDEETERLWAITLSAMPPEKAIAYGAFWEALREGLRGGILQPRSLDAIGSGLNAAIQDALTRTRQTLEEGEYIEPSEGT